MDGVSVLEMSHSEVVSLIQGLPVDFRLVVARKREFVDEELPIATEADVEVESQPTEFERKGEKHHSVALVQDLMFKILGLFWNRNHSVVCPTFNFQFY